MADERWERLVEQQGVEHRPANSHPLLLIHRRNQTRSAGNYSAEKGIPRSYPATKRQRYNASMV
jgi:hypothetical protein